MSQTQPFSRSLICMVCPSQNAIYNMVGQGSLSPRIMILIDTPYAFQQPYTNLLEELLHKLGYINNIYITPIVKHSGPRIDARTKGLCSHILEAEIKHFQPRIIIAMGKHSWDTIHLFANVNHDLNIYRSEYNIQINNRDTYIFNTYSPEYALVKNLNKRDSFIEDLIHIQTKEKTL